MYTEFKGTENWRIRFYDSNDPYSMFFIEADLPHGISEKHYPRVEVLQEDFGDHNGYSKELRLADATLIAHAPAMLSMLQKVSQAFKDANMPAAAIEIDDLINQATTL